MLHFLLSQTARWKVTSKEALQRIGEYSEAAITIRGTYFPPGKEPKEGERKIYLAIESTYYYVVVRVLDKNTNPPNDHVLEDFLSFVLECLFRFCYIKCPYS